MTPENFIDKKQVRQLFGGVSRGTIDRWVQTGKLPKPTRRFFLQQWNYDELVIWLRAKQSEKQFE